jgi:Protein of unknown function (DUF3106)
MRPRVKVGEWHGNQDRPWANRRQSLHRRSVHASHSMFALCLVFFLALAQGTLVYGQEASASKAPIAAPWAKLTPLQREALQPLGQVWDTLPSSRQLKWVALAANYSAMTPDDQVTLQSRMRDWAALGSKERDQARISFSETRKLTDEEKRAKWEAYKALSDAEKKALAKQSGASGGVAAKPATPLPQDKKVNMPAPTPTVRPSPLANATVGASQPVASGLGGSSEKHKPKLADVREKTSPNTLLPTVKQ